MPCYTCLNKKVYITVTFGPSYKKESPRIDVAAESYSNQWTHRALVSSIEEIDDELIIELDRRSQRFPGCKEINLWRLHYG